MWAQVSSKHTSETAAGEANGAARLLAAGRRAYAAVPLSLSIVASFTLVLLMLLICADIFLRFFFNRPINGVTDIVSLTIVACVFLQLGSAIRNQRLIRAEFLMGGWSRTHPGFANCAQAVFFALASFVLFRALLWLSSDFAKSYQTDEFSGAVGAYMITVWPFKLGVVIGCTVALVEAIRQTLLAARRAAPEGLAACQDWLQVNGLPLALFIALLVGFLYANFGFDNAPLTTGAIAFAGLLICVAMGMPIAFALLALSWLGIWLIRGNPVVADNGLGIAASGAVRSYEFGVVPLFVMMGLILDKADVGRDAFEVAVTLLRRLRGGLGIATVAANAIFASITGSSIASAAVFSRIAVPPMIEGGYTRRFSVGVVAGSSVLGMLIPPSLLLIIYGLIAEASVGDLFIAAIIPGLLLALVFSLLNYGMATYFPNFVGVPHAASEDVQVAPRSIVLRLLPVIFIIAFVMGGIYGGVFTPTEAGAVGAFAALVVALVRRRLNWPAFRSLVLETGYISAGILFLITAANLYGRMLTLSSIPMSLTSFIAAQDLSLLGFLTLYLLALLVLGTILDSASIMLIMLPIAVPVVQSLGGDLIWFGVITVMAIEIGLLTPPFGLSIFVVKGALPPGFATLGDIFTGAAPFVIAMLLVTVILIAFPQITLALL